MHPRFCKIFSYQIFKSLYYQIVFFTQLDILNVIVKTIDNPHETFFENVILKKTILAQGMINLQVEVYALYVGQYKVK